VGVSQGFSHFDDRMASPDGLRTGHRERRAGATTDSAIDWLAGRSDDDARFFLWVHYQDPHGPYAPPDEYAELFAGEPVSARRLPIGTTSSGLGQIPAYQALAGEQRPDVYRNLYDAEIRYFDSEVGRLLHWLREAGFFADSLVLFTADHGESLGEHDYWFSHEQHLYREVVRVPLIVRFPAGMPRPQGLAVVGHLDVWPTVVDAFDLPAVPSRGTSLITAALPADRIAVHTFAPAGDPARWEGVSDGRYRLLTHGGRSVLFDVVADPEEREDLAQAEPRRVAALRGRYEEFMASGTGERVRDGVDLPLDAESRRALEALGYID
jgi:arylsulfatase A-like enzyme